MTRRMPDSLGEITMHWLKACLAATLLLSATAWADEAAPPLPKLRIDPQRVAVAGLSSGAYMATQAQLAYPEVFHGAALVAGGPWGCADGQLSLALGSCMKGVPPPDTDALVARAEQRARSGELGSLDALAQSHVYLLHGRADAVVAPAVAEAGAAFYRKLRDEVPGLKGMQVVDDGQRDFGHNLPVAASGNDCRKSESPYLGHCGFDAAGAIFAHLYGPAPRKAVAPRGQLRTFDQNAFRSGGADVFLADTGYVYLPPDCLAGKSCGLLVALHGCKQNAEAVGEAFVRDAGFNRWADVYDVAVLYPQTRASFAPLNPQACWDWWGYSGTNYDTRQGVQLRWLVDAVRAIEK